MPTMKAVQVPKPGADFEIVEREIPQPGPRQVRIRVLACGVCHSDVLTKDGLLPGISYPRVPGHEVAGVIDEVGAGVSGWKKGDRVGVGWHGGQDGTCLACRRGDFANCASVIVCGISYDGGYQEFMVAPVEALAHMPESLDVAEAAPLMCAGITTFNALRRSRSNPGHWRTRPPGYSVCEEIWLPRGGDRTWAGQRDACQEAWSGHLYRQCSNRCCSRVAKSWRRARDPGHGTEWKIDVDPGRRTGSERLPHCRRSWGGSHRSWDRRFDFRQKANTGLVGWNPHGFRGYVALCGDDRHTSDDREVPAGQSRRSLRSYDERKSGISRCPDHVMANQHQLVGRGFFW
jgi:Alcohol dehydrogenase GroES-like domain